MIFSKHDLLLTDSPYQNKTVRPEVSKGEHLIFIGMEIVKEVEALQSVLAETN
ncbi:MAG: hypothetical protein ACU84H_10940 [Gammaproteobacteria bacterium]